MISSVLLTDMKMQFIVYLTPPLELIDFYHQVANDDPIRKVLSCFASFEDVLERLDEHDCDNYGVFIRMQNPHNFQIYKQTSFFFQKPRLHKIVPVPIPPFYIYRRTVKLDMKPFVAYQQIWLSETLVHTLFSSKPTSIVFTAGDQARSISIHPLLKQVLAVSIEPVPLLVLDTMEHSLDFAEFVIGMLHQTFVEETDEHMKRNQQVWKKMSIDHRRKMYDIFPEEFIKIPFHVWNMLKSIDDAELLEEDVQELCEKYKKLTLD